MTAKFQALVVVALGLTALAINDAAQPEMVSMSKLTADDTEKAFEDSLRTMELLIKDETADEKVVQAEVSKEAPQENEANTFGASSNSAGAIAIGQQLPLDAVMGNALQAVVMMHAKMGGSHAGDLLLPHKGSVESEFEKDVLDLVVGLSKSGGAATPMGGSVKKIKGVIEKDMIPAITKAHKTNQEELDSIAKALVGCGKTKLVSFTAAKRQWNIYKGASPRHKTCRTTEASLYQENVACHSQWKDAKQVKVLKCKAFSEVSRKTGNQNSNKQIVTKGGSESVETYVTRISTTICGKAKTTGNGGYGQEGMLDQLLDNKEACERATKKFNDQTALCRTLDRKWHSQRKKCNNLQDQMDNAACKNAITIKDACESYSECYKDRRLAYDHAEKKVKGEEKDRKAEWKGTKRMLCIINAFADGKVEDVEITQCKEKTHSTDHLNIKYPKISDREKCEVPDIYPTTAAYKKAEFTPLPVLAKGKVDANECTGVREISTTPLPGSPSTCKCERITLNGPYSPGAMVKCEKCLDVRRTTDKNSCPTGTKMFAPRSREDWDTFLKSADPLRAPNWVIDVTRPQNGCGGCTRNNMNSATSAQSTWRTSDGSPWWLRSKKYSEPNGDYHANCYLDLWRTPKDADGVTFNDGKCSYHSKSYYCQSVKMSTSPKPGSPSGCTCKKVELNGEYSAGSLVKCVGCLDVRRSADKNSCPKGTKIFAPASRADWKTFIASATRLRNPHWIIDVTRPQNGCGGCTRHAMQSSTPAQATWRTADGSPWWLRSTRYGEPNGDYTANCYLDLWHNPANQDSVTFNDHKCNYHSKSYYCQGVKVKGSKPTAPPWNSAR